MVDLMDMVGVLRTEQFERLLVARWTEVVDSRKLIAFTLQCVRDNLDKLERADVDELPRSQTQIGISRFQPCENHFDVWVEFSVPLDGRTAVGTHELHLSLGGRLSLQNTVGSLFVEAAKP
jgi:hypothetical protein